VPGRYDAEIDQDNDNDSHVLMIRMVGGGKRVLDVGCWNGDMGAHLRQHNVEVVGVEQDPEAAKIAAERLDRVVVGDVQELDLEAVFGSGVFDAIVLGDVLEHLVDPRLVLSRLRPLLSPGGSVVASIPNVAHGSVRLHLLDGRFDYTDVGLLDHTHLRFFTRSTMERLFEDAGFVVVEERTTTVHPLAAPEAPLVGTDVDATLVERVSADPDAHVYQFVVRAVADDADHAIRSLRTRHRELEAEVQVLRRSAEGARLAHATGFVQLAVLHSEEDLPGEWCLRLLESELGRRMPEEIPVLLSAAESDPVLQRWADAVIRVGRSTASSTIGSIPLDVTSSALAGISGPPGPALLGVALHASRVKKGGDGVGGAPMLQLLGLLPTRDDYIVVAVEDDDSLADVEGLETALRRLTLSRQLVVLPLGGTHRDWAPPFPSRQLPAWIGLEDAVAVIDGAAAVVTTHPTVATMAYALATPHALLGGDHASTTLLATIGGGVATTTSDIDGAIFRTEALTADTPAGAPVRARVDDIIDELAAALPTPRPSHLAPLTDPSYVATLEMTVGALQRRLLLERTRMREAVLQRRDTPSSAETDVVAPEMLMHQLAALGTAADSYRRVIAELQERLYAATRVASPPAPSGPGRWTVGRVVRGGARRLGIRRR
jgi:2-polyprenyl-3-methyl-5-hydroxy-6-metoxy-1,4-benzoquinol methylase